MRNEAMANHLSVTEASESDASWSAPERERTQILLDSIFPLDQLFDRGRTLARKSGTLSEQAQELRSLSDYALAIARDTHLAEYDPAKNQQDRLREAEHEKHMRERDEAELALRYANAEVGERQDELAQITTGMPEPHVSLWTAFFAATVLALSVAPTLHDRFFFGLGDQVLAWLFSGVAASTIGALITWALVGSIATVGQRTAANVLGMLAGVGIGIANGAIRLADASNRDEYLFAAGLTLLEISTVVFLEWLARGLRGLYLQWFEHQGVLSAAKSRVEAVIKKRDSRKEEVQTLQQNINDHMRYVESRWVRHNKVADIESAAVKAIINGYQQGLAENLGRVRGLKEA
jgi:hypothetical protein